MLLCVHSPAMPFYFQLPTLISFQINSLNAVFGGESDAVFEVLISNAKVLHKAGNPANPTQQDVLLPPRGVLFNVGRIFTFAVQKTNLATPPTLSERIFVFTPPIQGAGALKSTIRIINKDSVERQITIENLKSFQSVAASLVIQVETAGNKAYSFVASAKEEFNTMIFLLGVVRGSVQPGNLLSTYPREALFLGWLDKLVGLRWSPRYIVIVPHRIFSFANDVGVDFPRNVVSLRNATIRFADDAAQGEERGSFEISHPSMSLPFIFRVPNSPKTSDKLQLRLHSAQVRWALELAIGYSKTSPLFENTMQICSSASGSGNEETLPLDSFLMFGVRVGVQIPPPPFYSLLFEDLISSTEISKYPASRRLRECE